MDDDELQGVLNQTAGAVRESLLVLEDWGLAGTKEGQHHSDLAADAAATSVLSEAGLSILSEESGRTPGDPALLAVVDPLDGSTNAAQGIPWYATSLCVLDSEGPRVSLVENLVSGDRYRAVRGRGADKNGGPIAPSACETVDRAIVGLSGYPTSHLGWRQFRALGAAALDLCCVAEGVLDAYVDCSVDGLGAWDYLGAMLVCTEAGAALTGAGGQELVVRGPHDRRHPVACASEPLMSELGPRVSLLGEIAEAGSEGKMS